MVITGTTNDLSNELIKLISTPEIVKGSDDIAYIVMEPCYTSNYELYCNNTKLGYFDGNMIWH